MRKIMIIGCCGAGKSTLARQLHQILDIELIHLDQYYWQPNWVETSSQEWKIMVEKLAQKEQWIIDGNYGGTLDIRLAQADTIIFLNYPPYLCLYRVIKRILRYHGRVRPDMPQGCRERFDYNFLKYVYTFKRKKVPAILTKLEHLSSDKKVFIFNKDAQTRQFLKKLSNLSIADDKPTSDNVYK